jgi:hypothetical protein
VTIVKIRRQLHPPRALFALTRLYAARGERWAAAPRTSAKPNGEHSIANIREQPLPQIVSLCAGFIANNWELFEYAK